MLYRAGGWVYSRSTSGLGNPVAQVRAPPVWCILLSVSFHVKASAQSKMEGARCSCEQAVLLLLVLIIAASTASVA